MRIGITYDLREDYGIDPQSLVFADFCHPDEIGYMAENIRKCGHEPVMIGNMYHLNERILSGDVGCDLVLVCDEGIMSRNREAIVPALLELNKIPYIGSDAYAMGLSQNKYHTKLVCEALGIRCPKGIYIPYTNVSSDSCALQTHPAGDSSAVQTGSATDPEAKRTTDHTLSSICQKAIRDLEALGLSWPFIVKPNEEGYSMGVFLVHSEDELADAIRYNFDNYKEGVLVEEYIKGKELYAPIIGTGDESYVLGIGICKHEDGSDFDIFSLYDKCFNPIRDEIPDLPEEARQQMIRDSLLIHRHLECRDFGRCDFKLTDEGEAVMIEINPRPGLTEGGPFENCGNAAGKSYVEVLGEIIDSARKRYHI